MDGNGMDEGGEWEVDACGSDRISNIEYRSHISRRKVRYLFIVMTIVFIFNLTDHPIILQIPEHPPHPPRTVGSSSPTPT